MSVEQVNQNPGDEDERRVREKAEAREHSEDMWRTLGNLSEAEIKELANFEFDKGPETVNGQVRRYYLKLKSGGSSKAEEMLAEIGVVDESLLTDEGIQELCAKLNKYISGSIIYHKGKIYSIKGKGIDKL